MAKFALNSDDLQKLEESIVRLQETGEKTINEVLHNESGDKVIQSIQSLINVSSKRKGTHARHGKPFKLETFNLGFFIKTYPRYGYLIFPDEGRGVRNPIEQDFSGKGIEKERPNVVDRLLQVLTQKIKEEL